MGAIGSRVFESSLHPADQIDHGILLDIDEVAPNQEERTQFRSIVNTSGLTSIVQRASEKLKIVSDLSAVGTYELDDELQQAISHLLADSVGPLASRMVRRALRGATCWSNFSERLLDKIPSDAERSEFRQQLAKFEPE